MTRWCVDDHGRRRTDDHRINYYHRFVNDRSVDDYGWRDNYPRRMDDGPMNHHRGPGKVHDRSAMMTMDDTSGADHRERRRAAQNNKSKRFHRVLSSQRRLWTSVPRFETPSPHVPGSTVD